MGNHLSHCTTLTADLHVAKKEGRDVFGYLGEDGQFFEFSVFFFLISPAQLSPNMKNIVFEEF